MSKKSLRNKGHYVTYKASGLFSKNKEAKLVRHLKAHPEDTVAASAVKKVPAKSSRAGYAGPASKRGAVNQMMSKLNASVRSAERVYATIKDQAHTMVLGKSAPVTFTDKELRKLFPQRR